MTVHWPWRHSKKAVHTHHLQGYVSTSSTRSELDSALEYAVTCAKAKDSHYQRYQSVANKFSSKRRRITTRLADTLDYTLMYRGVSPSSEAADVILGEKNKVKSFGSAKYMQQKISDELSLKISTLTLQLAMDAGHAGTAMYGQASSAYTKLCQLTGPTAAGRLLQAVRVHAPVTPLADVAAGCFWQTKSKQVH